MDLTAGGSQTVEAKNIILAVGSEVSPLPTAVVDNAGKRIVDSTGALDLTEVPKKLVVVGGGVIGLEMGSVWRRLGSEVTVVEFLDTITPGMDKEITQSFLKILKKQGFNFMLNTKVTGTKVEGNGVKLTVEPSAGGAATQLDADVVLVSTGRRPFTKNIGLEALGIETDKIGRIKVDHHFQTKVPSIFAIGDAIDGPMLAHKAEEEGIACVENIAGFAGHVNYDAIPGVIYTHPEVASVGQTEEQLIKAGVKYTKGTFPFQANSRARATLDADGTCACSISIVFYSCCFYSQLTLCGGHFLAWADIDFAPFQAFSVSIVHTNLHAHTGLVKGLADKETDKILGMPNAGKRVSKVFNAAQIEEKVVKNGHKLRRLFYNFTVTKTSRMCSDVYSTCYYLPRYFISYCTYRHRKYCRGYLILALFSIISRLKKITTLSRA